jgi:formate hydrogenlyase transcriptional activator
MSGATDAMPRAPDAGGVPTRSNQARLHSSCKVIDLAGHGLRPAGVPDSRGPQQTPPEEDGYRDRSLLELVDRLRVHREVGAMVPDVAACLRRVVDFEHFDVVLSRAAGEPAELYSVALASADAAPSSARVEVATLPPLVHTRLSQLWGGHEPVVLQGLEEASSYAGALGCFRREGTRSACLLPLATAVRPVGVMALASSTAGAYDDADRGFLARVASQIAIAVDHVRAHQEIASLKERLALEELCLEDEIRSDQRFGEIVGESKALQRVLAQARSVAETDAAVLLLGETGTGKELVARAIHAASGRRSRAMVTVNCATSPAGLLESEWFGHEKGAFTGALNQKTGRFELAHQGTLFLDEIGDVPLELQPKLLRALQEREIERLGSTRTIRVDFRLIAATNRDLGDMVAKYEFRSDLYYRLNVFPIAIPPLRDRREDIPPLVRYYTQRYAKQLGRNVESIARESMDALCRWHWPGNVRELQNVVERAVILSRGPVLRVPLSALEEGPQPPGSGVTLEDVEREHILRTLKDTGWVIGGPRGAANRLGLRRTTLVSTMRRLGVVRPRPEPARER